jgi:predicted RND superfamily exporter protein
VLAKGQARHADVDAALGPAVEELDGDGRQAFATGEPILLAVVSSQLLQTIVRSMLITLFTVLVLLVVVYWRYRDAPTLGVITMLPVVLALTLIVGTMHLLDIPFNIMTALITSFTIGMGVDYAIHVSERYVYELERHDESIEALRAGVLGTGGALLGSAATTAGGFAVLVFSILNPLQQFGVVTALTIVFAFFASVLVLPSLLVLWTRHLRPAHHLEPEPATTPDPEAGDD